VQISMTVPYDEGRLRRTLAFLIRPQVKACRIMFGVLIVLGGGLVALEPATPLGYAIVILGVLFVVGFGPITVARSMNAQSNVIKDAAHMTLDDEWVTVSYPLAESRFRWPGLGRVVETPEVWYLMFGKFQAVTVPRDTMTQEQRAEFAAFVDGLRSSRIGAGTR
jgi:hypothetical protein